MCRNPWSLKSHLICTTSPRIHPCSTPRKPISKSWAKLPRDTCQEKAWLAWRPTTWMFQCSISLKYLLIWNLSNQLMQELPAKGPRQFLIVPRWVSRVIWSNIEWGLTEQLETQTWLGLRANRDIPKFHSSKCRLLVSKWQRVVAQLQQATGRLKSAVDCSTSSSASRHNKLLAATTRLLWCRTSTTICIKRLTTAWEPVEGLPTQTSTRVDKI